METIHPESLGFTRVLAVGAHPDDAEFYAGATLARLAAAGAEVSLIVVTDGQRGGREAGNLAGVRAAEQVHAAAALGIGTHRNLGRPDGELTRDLDVLRELVLALRTVRPDLVLTHDLRTRFTLVDGIAQLGHSDHRMTAELVMDAVAPRGFYPSFFPEQLTQPDVQPWYPRELWLFDTAEPTIRVPVAPVQEAKLAALRAHASQNDGDMLVRWSAKRGDEAHVRLVLRRR